MNHLSLVGFDTETHLFAPGNMAPKMVCLSVAEEERSRVVHRDFGAYRVVYDMLTDPTKLLVGHNVSYDLAVIVRTYPNLLRPVFDALESDRITCTLVRQKLLDIAAGTYKVVKNTRGYTLLALSKFYDFHTDLEKDTWRLKYGELDEIPFEQWPAGAVEYSRLDAEATQWVALNQDAVNNRDVLVDQFRQTRAQFALHLCSVYGITTDPAQVRRYSEATQKALDDARALLEREGIVYQDKKGWHKRTKVAGARMLAAWPDCPKTPKGAPKLDADSCEQSLDEVLIAYAKWGEATAGNNHAQELDHPIIHTRFDSLLVSGRTSSSGPNIQNRSTQVGDRECFVARPGCVFLDLDYDGLELKTVAQVLVHLFGKSKLADAINGGLDPHSVVGAEILGIPYEVFVKRKKDPHDKQAYLARQSGKIANFGLAGGLGWRALQKQARALYGVVLSDQEARALIASWFKAWPEFKQYFAWIASQCGGGNAWITQLYTDRVRGDCPYTEACNTLFQGLGADVAKAGLWALTKACYTDTKSPLYNARLVNFVHDQFIVETLEENLDAKCAEMERVVMEASNRYLPDCPATGKAIVCRRWSKLAEARYENGKLVAWEWEGAVS